MSRRRPSSEDRVLGTRPRERRDLFAGCNEPGTPAYLPNPADFMRVWCARCRHSDCIRAKSVVHAWERRMEEQPEYLLNAPQFSDLTDPRHQAMAAVLFQSLKAKAERLEIAAARQDWEIPEGPTDGMARVAPGTVTKEFDVAVRELARAKGRERSDLPEPASESVAAPSFFEEEEAADSDVEYETQFPSSTVRGKSYRVALVEGAWSCECDGFKHVGRCKHLDEVRAWYEQQSKEPEPAPEPPRPPAAPPTANDAQMARDPRVPEMRPLNTPMHPSGVMLDGGAATPMPQRQSSPPSRSTEPADPWAPRRDEVVESGATIRPKKGP